MAARSTNEKSSTPETGLHDSAPKRKTVEDYPERPYGEAITKEHREFLAEHGVHVTKSTTSEQDAVSDTA